MSDDTLRKRIEILADSWDTLIDSCSEIMTTPQRNAWRDAASELRYVLNNSNFPKGPPDDQDTRSGQGHA